MKSRVCPGCNVTLGEYDGYFCSSCGKKLPEDIIVSIPTIKAKKYLSSSEVSSTKKRFNQSFDWSVVKKAKVLIVALIIGLMYFPLNYVYTKLVVSKPDEVIQAPLSPIEKKTIGYNLVLKSSSFSTESFASYVPYDVDLYIEGVDFMSFVDTFVSSETFGELLIGKARILVEDTFAVFSITEDEGHEWVVILVPKDKEIVEAVVQDLEDSYWKFSVINEYFVAASDEDLFQEISDAKEGLEKNLLLNPDYVTEINRLPSSGQVLFMFFDDRGVDAVNLILTDKLNEEFYSAMDSVLEKGVRYLVVDNINEPK